MSRPTADTLTQRLDRLERENRRLKRLGAVMLSILAALMLMGQALPKSRIVEAEKFIVKDATGKVRATLAVEANGLPVLRLHDRNGTRRIELRLGYIYLDPSAKRIYEEKAPRLLEADQGPVLALFNEKGDVSASLSLGLWSSAKPSLTLNDEDGESHASLFAGGLYLFEKTSSANPGSVSLSLSGGKSSLTLWGRNHSGYASVEVEAEGAPKVVVSGKGHAEMRIGQGIPVLSLTDKDFHTRIHLAVGADGSPSLLLLDKDKKIRTVLGSVPLEVLRRPASSLVMFDEHGKVIWKAP